MVSFLRENPRIRDDISIWSTGSTNISPTNAKLNPPNIESRIWLISLGWFLEWRLRLMWGARYTIETHVSKILGACPSYKKIRRKSARIVQCRKHGAIPQKRRNRNSARARAAQSLAKTVQSWAKTAHSSTKIENPICFPKDGAIRWNTVSLDQHQNFDAARVSIGIKMCFFSPRRHKISVNCIIKTEDNMG